MSKMTLNVLNLDNRRMKRAEQKRDYVKASYYYARHMARFATLALVLIESEKRAFDFSTH